MANSDAPPWHKIFLYTHSVHQPATQLIKTDQQEFILSMAHFYKKARDAGELDIFFERFCKIWFTKWKLTARDFKPDDFEDKDFVAAVEAKIKKTLHRDLRWYCCCKPSPLINHDQTWQQYMRFREARAGIFTYFNNPKDLDFVPPPHRSNVKRMPLGIIPNSDKAAAQVSANNTSSNEASTSSMHMQDSPIVIEEIPTEIDSADEDLELNIYVDSD